jgi:2-polyprenyl-6-methoxyphenol hydroxylase-like FAD-dependent oxidoreductase
MPRAVVIGAGIGGLTAALALRKAGFDVGVYEQSERIERVGAGISLQHNALSALAAIGLREEILAAGAPIESMVMSTARGSTLFSGSIAEITGNDRACGVGIHRADLQRVLYDAVGAGAIHLGRRCLGFELQDRSAIAKLEGGAEEADLIVGADGIHSAIAAQLQGRGEPRSAGYSTFRGISATDPGLERGRLSEVLGDSARLGAMFVDATRIYWFLTVTADPRASIPPEERRARAIALAAELPEIGRALIASTPEDEILYNAIVDRPFDPRWGEGRLTLLGDAAHAMTPNLGQGACQAIEDAAVLGACVQREPDVEAALRSYERIRRPRARWFVRESRRVGQIAQLENPLLCWLRDTASALTPRSLILSRMRAMQTFEAP